MDCLKCGRQTKDKEVFCPDCLAVMAVSPVKSDTPVILPQRKASTPRSAQKKIPKAEEIITQLQKKLKALRIAVAVLLILFTIAAGGLGVMLYQQWSEPEMGSNYSTFTSTEATQDSTN